MPNTLAHFAVHGLVTRRLLPRAGLPWIYLGCVIPDLPWVGQRLARVLAPSLDEVSIRLYGINQASLFVSLLLCAGLAALTNACNRVFAILGLGCLLHLLLDACEIKWGNGVSLFVPIDWRTVRFDFFWPESVIADLITMGGLAYFAITFKAATSFRPDWSRSWRRWGLGLMLIVCYFTTPVLWFQPAVEADNHYVQTLSDSGGNVGKVFEIDRSVYHEGSNGSSLENLTGKMLVIPKLAVADGTSISVRGRIVGPGRAEILEQHAHRSYFREAASLFGLALVAALWLWCLVSDLVFNRSRQRI